MYRGLYFSLSLRVYIYIHIHVYIPLSVRLGGNFPEEFRVGDLCRKAAAFVPRRLEHCAHNFNIAVVQKRHRRQSAARENSILISPDRVRFAG